MQCLFSLKDILMRTKSKELIGRNMIEIEKDLNGKLS